MLMLIRAISNHFYTILGIVIGLYISSIISNIFAPCLELHLPSNQNEELIIHEPLLTIQNSTKPINNTSRKWTTINSKKTKLIRPRYYSTELGIKEKLFIGIFTSEEKVISQAIHLNRTIGHLVDKIKFFITAQYKLKTKFNVTGLVGFTDTRYKFRPFQVMKYVGDNFAQDYDYYFFTNDYTFINIYKLKDLVRKISVSMDVYLGVKVKDGSYCSLDSGIILSNSVLKAVREHLDWCVINAISDDHSENIGRCVHHSIGLSCQESIQDQTLDTFKMKHFELNPHLLELTKKLDFNKAITIYPVLQSDSFYLLNSYFLKQRLAEIKQEIVRLSNDLLTDDDIIWPKGQKSPTKPATRFDLPHQYYFNMTHMFFVDDFNKITKHSQADLIDIENVIEEVKRHFDWNSKQLQYRRLVNGYRTFDLSRGIDYTLDLGFRDLQTGKEVIKRFEVCKPLGKVEFIPSVPYVTENVRVTIILPIEETQVELAMDFLTNYMSILINPKEKGCLMLTFLYQMNSASKGKLDPFNDIKNFVLKITNKYHSEDIKIVWVSIRLPSVDEFLSLQSNKQLNFAIIDLALKKIGLESLILVLDVYSNITIDFLNRVRMNTIPNYQIFSPIPFRQYNPKITQFPFLEVNKNSGHFDKEEFRYISFYAKDYVNARKKFQQKLPIIKIDNDITSILNEQFKRIGNIFEMFLLFGGEIHCMRATEMNLKIKYHTESDEKRCNWFLGSEAQLAKVLLTKRKEIPFLYEEN